MKERGKRFGRIRMLAAAAAVVMTAVDQLSKVIVMKTVGFGDPSKQYYTGFFHIHPVRNMKTAEAIARRAQEGSFGKGFYMALELAEIAAALALAVLLICFIHKLTLLANRGVQNGTVTVLISLSLTMFLCGAFDRLFYEGAVDFLCVTFPAVSEDGSRALVHFSFDVKDVYVYLFGVLTLYYLLRVVFSILFFRAKDPDGFSAFKEKVRALFRRKKDGGNVD
ncbi:MAG: signal peptidase II [Clostridia bacterium]|nr:signal peptidase II [Clostridia bacterium]